MNFFLAAILRELDAAEVEYRVEGGGETLPVTVSSCQGQLELTLSCNASLTGNDSLELAITFAIRDAIRVGIRGTSKSLVLTAEPTLTVLRESRVTAEALAQLPDSEVWEQILRTATCDVRQLFVCILSFVAFVRNRTEGEGHVL